MSLRIKGLTDTGLKRSRNEDSFRIEEDLGLCVVCDGVGGHTAGEVASEMAPEIVIEAIRQRGDDLHDASARPGGHFELLDLMETAVEDACRRIHERSLSEPKLGGMATTLTCLLVVDNKGLLAHVGDCRLYVHRAESLHRLTRDHTLARELVERGVIKTEEGHPGAHVLTRTVGHQPSVQVDTLMFDLFPGDVCVLCSDGLIAHASDTEIASWIRQESVDELPEALVELAKSRGGSDNITVVALEVDETARSSDPVGCEERALCLDALSSVFLFRDTGLTVLNRVLPLTSIRRLEKGAIAIEAGDECPGLFVVLDGSLTVGANGKAELTQYQHFGELSLFRSRSSAHTIRAAEASRLLYLDRADFRRLLTRHPRLANRVRRRVISRLTELVDRHTPHEGPVLEPGWF